MGESQCLQINFMSDLCFLLDIFNWNWHTRLDLFAEIHKLSPLPKLVHVNLGGNAQLQHKGNVHFGNCREEEKIGALTISTSLPAFRNVWSCTKNLRTIYSMTLIKKYHWPSK